MIKLRENEKVYLTVRPHIFTLITDLLPFKLFFKLIIIGIILILIFLPLWPEQLIEFVPDIAEFNMSLFLVFIGFVTLLILWSAIFIIIIDYYLDCWIVTNERTIHTELIGLFNRTISVVQHDQIQDISVDIKGIFPVMLNYGDVHIQTAGKFREFVFKQVPSPYKVKSAIFEAQKDNREANNSS